MLLMIALVLAILWVFGFVVFHVSSAVIHLLLLLAVVGVIAHLVRSASARGTA